MEGNPPGHKRTSRVLFPNAPRTSNGFALEGIVSAHDRNGSCFSSSAAAASQHGRNTFASSGREYQDVQGSTVNGIRNLQPAMGLAASGYSSGFQMPVQYTPDMPASLRNRHDSLAQYGFMPADPMPTGRAALSTSSPRQAYNNSNTYEYPSPEPFVRTFNNQYNSILLPVDNGREPGSVMPAAYLNTVPPHGVVGVPDTMPVEYFQMEHEGSGSVEGIGGFSQRNMSFGPDVQRGTGLGPDLQDYTARQATADDHQNDDTPRRAARVRWSDQESSSPVSQADSPSKNRAPHAQNARAAAGRLVPILRSGGARKNQHNLGSDSTQDRNETALLDRKTLSRPSATPRGPRSMPVSPSKWLGGHVHGDDAATSTAYAAHDQAAQVPGGMQGLAYRGGKRSYNDMRGNMAAEDLVAEKEMKLNRAESDSDETVQNTEDDDTDSDSTPRASVLNRHLHNE